MAYRDPKTGRFVKGSPPETEAEAQIKAKVGEILAPMQPETEDIELIWVPPSDRRAPFTAQFAPSEPAPAPEPATESEAAKRAARVEVWTPRPIDYPRIINDADLTNLIAAPNRYGAAVAFGFALILVLGALGYLIATGHIIGLGG
jgi:hypothetical protein